MRDAAEFWNSVADRYARRAIGNPEAYRFTLERTRAHLGPEDDVLELGCGTGSTALLLAPHVARYTASDLAPRMIEIAREKARAQDAANLEFIATELRDPRLAERPRDAVLALNLLHLVDDLPGALAHIHEMLRPGGLLIAKTVCRPGRDAPILFHLAPAILPLLQWLGKLPRFDLMKVETLERHIARAGFEILEAGNHPPPSRFIVARRA